MPIEINSSNKLINCNNCIQHVTCLMHRDITFDISPLRCESQEEGHEKLFMPVRSQD